MRGGDRRPAVAVQQGLGRRVVRALEERTAALLPRDSPRGCEESKLLDAPVLLALHPDRASGLGLAVGEPADLAALADAPWLTPVPVASCYERIQRACGTAGFVPRIRARSSDFSVLTALAADALPGGVQLP
ncbi:hypothetical protein LIU39_08280 [Streptomyces sp. SF28]|nr:hypothetical protein [Streptomyces pinistramenti]